MMDDTYEWVWKTGLSQYAGQWVVVLDKRVVANGDRKVIGKELAQIRKKYPGARPLVMKIPLKTAIIL